MMERRADKRRLMIMEISGFQDFRISGFETFEDLMI